MRYYLNDAGGTMAVSDSPLSPPIPDGYEEVTEEEYGVATGLVVLNDPRAAGGAS